MFKVCNVCQLEKSNFSRNKAAKDGLQRICKDCEEVHNRRQQLKRYGLTPETYESLLATQNYRCAICELEEDRRRFSVDHDHSCCPGKKTCGKCIRGLLCHKCNVGLGMFNNDIDVLRKTIKYLVPR